MKVWACLHYRTDVRFAEAPSHAYKFALFSSLLSLHLTVFLSQFWHVFFLSFPYFLSFFIILLSLQHVRLALCSPCLFFVFFVLFFCFALQCVCSPLCSVSFQLLFFPSHEFLPLSQRFCLFLPAFSRRVPSLSLRPLPTGCSTGKTGHRVPPWMREGHEARRGAHNTYLIHGQLCVERNNNLFDNISRSRKMHEWKTQNNAQIYIHYNQ